MSNPNPSLMKTCSICGQQKPLSAFLQLSGSKGAIYGNICSSCRKAQADKPVKEADEGTRRETGGSKIRANERIAAEIEKKQHQQRIEDSYEEERIEEEEIRSEQNQKTEKISKNEKIQREKFLIERTFLNGSQNLKRDESQVFGGEQQAAKEREINLSAPFMDTQIAGKEKFKSSVFNQFKTWLGGAAPIGQPRHPSTAIGEHRKQTNEKTPAIQMGEKNKQTDEKAKTESLTDRIEKTWGPRR